MRLAIEVSPIGSCRAGGWLRLSPPRSDHPASGPDHAFAQSCVDVSTGSGIDDFGGANGLSFRDLDDGDDLGLGLAREHDGYRVLENLGGNRLVDVLQGEATRISELESNR